MRRIQNVIIVFLAVGALCCACAKQDGTKSEAVNTDIIEIDLSEFHATGSVLGIQDSIKENLGVDWKETYVMLAYAYNAHEQAGIVFFHNQTVDPLCIVKETYEEEYAYHIYSYCDTYLYELGNLIGTQLYWKPEEYGLILETENGWTRWEYNDFNLVYYGESELEEGYEPIEFTDITNLKELNLTSDTIENFVQ